MLLLDKVYWVQSLCLSCMKYVKNFRPEQNWANMKFVSTLHKRKFQTHLQRCANALQTETKFRNLSHCKCMRKHHNHSLLSIALHNEQSRL